MSLSTATDPRIVMTLDAGGTNLKFSAMQGNKLLVGPISTPSESHDLTKCLSNIVRGFEDVKAQLPAAPVAISFAFPGPCDYPNGIVGDLGNLPGFRGGVALGPMLADKFGIPTFLNNDGDLFAYGEAIAGYLPWVNSLLEAAGSPKRYRNLFGLTLGTGLGGGIVRDGELFIGDNSMAGEVWLSRNRLQPGINAEEGAAIRAVRRTYAEIAGMAFDAAPEPKVIFEIGIGMAEGNQAAAREAFRRMGLVAGDVIAQALTLVDSLVVIGGGISAAHPLFLPALLEAVNGTYEDTGDKLRRAMPLAFNLENEHERAAFVKGETKEIVVPGSGRTMQYDPLARTAVGLSRLGTSEAVAVGAYAFALRRLG